MKDIYNMFIPKFSEEETNEIYKKIDPKKNRACNNNILWGSNSKEYSGNYYGHSLKRSQLSDCCFDNAQFDHTSLSGSTISNVKFRNTCTFDSVYLEQSTLTDVDFESNLYITNCNFSNSQLKHLHFRDLEIRSTYFDNCYMDECDFYNCKIRSTMFDNSYMVNCKLINCNMRNLNIEFLTLEKCDLTGTTISYFQLPYIIGIFDKENKILSSYVGIHQNKTIPITDYLKNVNEAIIYFTGLEEYFPLANLYYAKGEYNIAYNCIQHGIKKCLLVNDIRMIENFCKLGQTYDLLNITDIQQILRSVDKMIEKQRNTTLYSLLLSKSYHLKASLSQNSSKAKLEIVINTNISGENFDVVSKFCNDVDSIISCIMPNRLTTSYQLSHNSPFEICLTCIGLTADLIAVSGFIYSFISNKLDKNAKLSPEIEAYIKKSNEMYIESLNNEFDAFEQIINNTKKSKQASIIKEFRGKIITTATNQIDKDLALLVSQSAQ